MCFRPCQDPRLARVLPSGDELETTPKECLKTGAQGDPIMLTLVIFVIATAALSALAIRFGCDSRPGAWSGEQEYAAHGFANLDRRSSPP